MLSGSRPDWMPLAIDGVAMLSLKSFGDDRGRFLEVFRREWIPGAFIGPLQVNCSTSSRGVLRGLHYHRHQTDIWVPVGGRLRAGLADARRESPTFGHGMTLDLDAQDPAALSALLIPPGVAHGFAALTDITLIYVVDRYYDVVDELGIAWDDPVLGLDWGLSEPVLSGRDRQNLPFDWRL
jgi:dTDP-4-dehydrorhamnose 3,5-epimerase